MHTYAPLAADVLQPLHSLRQLTALETGVLDDAGFGAAALLTQLWKLTVWVNEESPHAHTGLLPFTRLQRLTELPVFWEHGGYVCEDKVRWVGVTRAGVQLPYDEDRAALVRQARLGCGWFLQLAVLTSTPLTLLMHGSNAPDTVDAWLSNAHAIL